MASSTSSPESRRCRQKASDFGWWLSAHSWEAQYRPEDAAEFQTAATGELPPPNNDQVSIQCYHGPPDEEHWIRFEHFSIKQLS